MDDRANEEMTAAERILREANEEMTAGERPQSSTFKLANEGTEAMLRVQKELLDMYDRASRNLLARLKPRSRAIDRACCRARHDTFRPRRHKNLSGVHIAPRGDDRGGRTTAVERGWTIMQKINLTNRWSAGST